MAFLSQSSEGKVGNAVPSCLYVFCVCVWGENSGQMSFPHVPPGPSLNRPLAHDITAPVTMHLEDKLAIYA